ncbi:hypothetical protein [Tunturiibacter psychrotolerans]|uniref:hypothetical protein n=1 Tax=Tunturiibacter psychrotolerans TaxID=3069686 RepID=UPI003D24B314
MRLIASPARSICARDDIERSINNVRRIRIGIIVGVTEIVRQFYRRAIGFASSNVVAARFRHDNPIVLIRNEDEFMPDRLSLTAIEEPGSEEDNSDHEGQARMEDVMQTQAEQRIRKPRGEAQKPYPRCLLEHPHSSMLQ